MKKFSAAYLIIIFGILYIPIVTMMLFSFNSSSSTANFTGFSFYWYRELFVNSRDVTFNALKNTLILALSSAALATVIGTAAAEGVNRMRSKLAKRFISGVTNIPMMNPDIVTGMSMMLLFVAVTSFIGIKYDDIGFIAMLIAHTTFCIPYVFLSVMPKVKNFSSYLSDAALDLGCTPIQAFFRVELPNIMPGVITGFIMAFTLSLDDFVISYFVGGTTFQTLPLLIYSMTKKKVTPDMYALSTLIIVVIFLLLVITNIRNDKEERKLLRANKNNKGRLIGK